jgi:ribosome-binding ATPase YchF (GTP1/OBG family)
VAALQAYAGEVAVVPVAASFEADLAELDDAEERTAFLAEIGQDEAGMPRVARAAFALLDLITFFTVGPKEARAWPLRRGSSAVEAAGKIHSDIARGFIRAEVISTPDMLSAKTHAEAQKRGVMRVEGRDYVVADGDVINVRFNV